MKTYQQIHHYLTAIENCKRSGNDVWLNKWRVSLMSILMDTAPSGSGFDNGTSIVDSTSQKMIFETAYHHMDDGGCYKRWTEHTVTVTPSFDGVNIAVSGRDHNSIKDYIAETFHEWLNSEAPDAIAE